MADSMRAPPTPTTPLKKNVTVKDYRRKAKDKPLETFILDLSKSGWDDLYKYMIEIKKLTKGHFSLSLPGHEPLDREKFNQLSSNSEIWILDHIGQKLPDTVHTPVRFDPHFHTITQSGMYEYYDSRGIDSLVISLAELIDNSLAATKENAGLRHIEIRHYDNGGDSMVLILDNGSGMDMKGLNDWARFKYSKFERKKKAMESTTVIETTNPGTPESGNTSFSSQDLPLRRNFDVPIHMPDSQERRPGFRYLDSDINYFGAGGKQAIFNIGQYTTMITKTAKLEEIYEMTISKKGFEEKSISNPEAVYGSHIITRPKGKERKVTDEKQMSEYILNEVVEEFESTYKSFTICCIKHLSEKHKHQFNISLSKREDEKFWCKQLSRIYHYYLHGPKGNVANNKEVIPNDLKNIAMFVKAFKVENLDRVNLDYETTLLYSINLKDITDDFESLLVRTAADTFEFEIELTDEKFANAVIEGVVRYHPYLQDRETIPRLSDDDISDTASLYSSRTTTNEDHLAHELQKKATKTRHKEVFECFWHGRLIPQDCIDFEWNRPNNRTKERVDDECFGRLSGALFTNCAFEVSQNKQSFMSLSKILGQKDRLMFYKLTKDNRRTRTGTVFENDFINWLKSCHKKYDKQVIYRKWERDVHRNDVTPLKKNSFSEMYWVFNEVEWRDRVLKKGDKIQTQKTKPVGLIGRISRFLVPAVGKRDNTGNYMGPPGFVEIYQLPAEIYGENYLDASKLITFKQLKLDTSDEQINEELGKLHDKLPCSIKVLFPDGDPILPKSNIRAGAPLPAVKVQVFNQNGDKLQTGIIPFKQSKKTLGIQLEILKVVVEGDKEETLLEVQYPIANFHKEHDYWFLKLEDGIKKAGNYRLKCICLNYVNKREDDFINKFPNGDKLPVADDLDFSVIAGPPNKFIISEVNSRVTIGIAFTLTLEFYDEFDNLAKPDPNWKPILSMENFKVTCTLFEFKGHQLVLKDVTIFGVIRDNDEAIIEITIPPFEKKQEVKVGLKKGPPSEIRFLGDTNLEIMNGTVPSLAILFFDRGGNDVTFDQPLNVFCKFIETDVKRSLKTALSEQQMFENLFENKRCLMTNKVLQIRRSEEEFKSHKYFARFYVKSMPSLVLEKDITIKKSSQPSMNADMESSTPSGSSQVSQPSSINDDIESSTPPDRPQVSQPMNEGSTLSTPPDRRRVSRNPVIKAKPSSVPPIKVNTSPVPPTRGNTSSATAIKANTSLPPIKANTISRRNDVESNSSPPNQQIIRINKCLHLFRNLLDVFIEMVDDINQNDILGVINGYEEELDQLSQSIQTLTDRGSNLKRSLAGPHTSEEPNHSSAKKVRK